MTLMGAAAIRARDREGNERENMPHFFAAALLPPLPSPLPSELNSPQIDCSCSIYHCIIIIIVVCTMRGGIVDNGAEWPRDFCVPKKAGANHKHARDDT